VATDFDLHVLAIGLEDRPGAVHSVAEVFSGRGLQMEAFHGTADSLNPDSHAQALILFRASSDRADLIMRVLRRLSSVRRAELLRMDDPRLLQSVLIRNDGHELPADIRLVHLGEGVALAAGVPKAIREWLDSEAPPCRLGAIRIDLLEGAGTAEVQETCSRPSAQERNEGEGDEL